MGIWISLLLLGGGVCLTVGLIYLGVGLHFATARIHLWLGLLGIFAAAMAVTEAWMYQSSTADDYGTAFQWQLGVTFVWGAILMVFVAEYVDGLRRIAAIAAMASMAVVVVNALSLHGIVFDQITELRQIVLPWGERIMMGRGPVDSLYWLLNVAVVLVSVYSCAACGIAARNKPRRQVLLLALALGAVIVFGSLGGFLVDTGILEMPYPFSLAIFFVVLAMSVDLASQVATRHQAAAANQAKSDFLARMSHELRTPLSTMIGTTDLLLTGRLPQPVRHQIEIIDKAAEALRALIEDVLDFAQLEAGRLRFETTDFSLRDLLAEVADLMASRAAEKDLVLDVRIDPAVPDALHGVPSRLRQVLLNLVGNAIKFTPKGRVEVRVEGIVKEPGSQPTEPDLAALKFIVRDTGIGISPADQKQIFETFYQADSSSARTSGGLGLGLAISKEIIERMDGEISLESQLGVGSTLSFALPWLPARGEILEASVPSTPPVATNDRRPFRILLVEDQTLNRNLARAHLELLGYQVVEAASGQDALERFAKAWADGEPFDAILMDCQMPELDGYATTRRLRQQAAKRGAKRTPILALTAHARPEEHDRCLAAGMDDCLSKPYRGTDLARALDRWLGTAESSVSYPPPDRGPAGEDSQTLLEERVDALRRLGQRAGRDLLGEAIDSYRHTGLAYLDKMLKALERRDAEDLAFATHSLAGLSGVLGAERLTTLLEEVETLALNGDLSDLDSRLRTVEAEHSALVARLSTAVGPES